MNLPPVSAECQELSRQRGGDTVEVWRVEAIVLAQLWRSLGAVQDEHRFTALADDMDMRRPVVVGVDDGAQAIEA
jgi:hypothetical protein